MSSTREVRSRLTMVESHRLFQFIQERYTGFDGMSFTEIARMASDELGFLVVPNHIKRSRNQLGLEWRDSKNGQAARDSRTKWRRVDELEAKVVMLRQEMDEVLSIITSWRKH